MKGRIVRFAFAVEKLDIVNGPGATEIAEAAIKLLNGQEFVPMYFTVVDPSNSSRTERVRFFCRHMDFLAGLNFRNVFRGDMQDMKVRVHYAFHNRQMNPCGEIIDDSDSDKNAKYARWRKEILASGYDESEAKKVNQRLNEECAQLMSHDDIGNKMG